ncbi:MAG: hypothetical protein U9R79_10025 [Armatimonadota bacterium]|nr:hypothetical protein [Armatimonadota bacterium]
MAAAVPTSADRRTLAVSVALALGLTAAIAARCVMATGGTLVYALDDPYIHLAMGRTLAQSGVWGVNEATPGAASSSPLWTFLLAGLTLLMGDAPVWLPLMLNVIAVAALVVVADAWLRELRVTARARVGVILAMLLVGPVVPLAMTGMEHVAHAAAVLALAMVVLRPKPASAAAIAGVAAVATGLRYESAFVALALAVVLAVRTRWTKAMAAVVGSAAVVGAIGLWQISLGEGFLPNSVNVKAVSFSLASASQWLRWKGFSALQDASVAPMVVLPVLALAGALQTALLDRGDATGTSRALAEMAGALALATLVHITLSRTGWYFRYEAYLVVWGALGAGAALVHGWRLTVDACRKADIPQALRPAMWTAGVAVGALVVLSTGLRINAYDTVHEYCRDIHLQHHQVARFLHAHYDDAGVVLHDIGYVGYLCDCRLVDMAGLATRAVVMAKKRRAVAPELARRLALQNGARIAVSYDTAWLPEEWLRVASWRNPANRAAGSDTVYFLAVEPQAAGPLLRRLRDFEQRLPPGLEVTYLSNTAASG